MSKMFLKTIGLVALSFLVNLITPESSHAMRSARRNDCLEDHRLEEKRQNYLRRIPGLYQEYEDIPPVESNDNGSLWVDVYNRFGEDTGQEVRWYICREKPTIHSIKEIITGAPVQYYDPTVTCTDCDDDRRKEENKRGVYKKDKDGKWVLE